MEQNGTDGDFRFQDDLDALLRAAGLPDHARPASPHQVVRQELLPQVQYLAARERVLAERVTLLENMMERAQALREAARDVLAEIGPLGGLLEPVKRLRDLLKEE